MVSNIFYFHPENWGNDPISRAYFSHGWFNHQLENNQKYTEISGYWLCEVGKINKTWVFELWQKIEHIQCPWVFACVCVIIFPVYSVRTVLTCFFAINTTGTGLKLKAIWFPSHGPLTVWTCGNFSELRGKPSSPVYSPWKPFLGIQKNK